jgi:hypothetical protein
MDLEIPADAPRAEHHWESDTMDLEIPADAPRAEHHAPPVNLNGDLPAQPTPSIRVTDEAEDTAETPQPRPKGSAPYSSPEPIEAMFAQVRSDIASQQKLLMLTATTVIFLSLLLAYTVKKGGFVVDA